jgi:hypothetical protein
MAILDFSKLRRLMILVLHINIKIPPENSDSKNLIAILWKLMERQELFDQYRASKKIKQKNLRNIFFY